MPARTIQDFDRAVAIKPSSHFPLVERASSKMELMDLDGAIADASAALALKADLPPAYDIRSYAYWGKKLYDLAIADFDALLKLLPNHSATLDAREKILAEKKKSKK